MKTLIAVVSCLLLSLCVGAQPGNPLDPPKGNPLDLPQPPGARTMSDDAVAKKLVGTWLVRTEEIEIRVVFRAEGTADRAMRTAEGSNSTVVKWSMENGKLKIVAPDETDLLNVKFVDDDTVELTDDEGDGVRMIRQKS